MKTFITIFIFFYSLNFNFLFAQSGWFWQNPLPQGNNLRSVRFINSNIGFAVGDCGTIMNTIDGGNSWTVQHYYENHFFKSTFFPNEFTGYAVGGNLSYSENFGVMYKTTNQGNTWFLLPNNFDFILRDVNFINGNTGFVIGGPGNDPFGAKILRTTNGGFSWSTYTIPDVQTLYSIFFQNVNTGYIVGGTSNSDYKNIILRTTNGGNTWNVQLLENTWLLRSVSFINSNTGFACGGDYDVASNYQSHSIIYKTIDSGINWIQIEQENQEVIRSICFSDSNNGYMVGGNDIWWLYDHIILKTTNGGLNWFKQNPISTNYLTSIFSLNSNLSIAVGAGGLIIKTTNGGNNWNTQSYGSNGKFYKSVCFINSSTGYVVGFQSQLVKTTNSGLNWNVDSSIGEGIYDQIYFIDENLGFIPGYSFIYKTTNGGINWISITGFEPDNIFLSVYFPERNIGYAVGGYNYSSQGKIVKTTDEGYTWNYQDIGNFGWLRSVYFINALTGFAAGDNGKILKTTDGGEQWDLINSGIISRINSIRFVNSSSGFASSDEVLLKTTNLGNSWFTSLNPSTLLGYFNCMYFLNQDTGLVFELNEYRFGYFSNIVNERNMGINENYYTTISRIHKTTNCGLNWLELGSITNNRIQSVYFINANTAYAVGERSTIIKTTNGGGEPLGINMEGELVPSRYILHQNFPNPFNPSTTIKYELSKDGFVKIKIFDITGREIKTLINEFKQAGSYSITFEGNNLPSGAYFYRLEGENFAETKRMIFLK